MACCTTKCWAVLVAVTAVLVVFFARTEFSAQDLIPSLKGQVAVVTGGSRGIGKGIAVGLGEAGATVYITGRTLSKGASNTGGLGGRSGAGSLEETCELVVRYGGQCIPVAADSGKDADLEELFERVMREQGRLDILVNNAFSAVSYLPKTMGQAFWEKGVDAWDWVNNVGLRSHYVASVYAAKHMSKLKRGLIINIGSFGGISYTFDVAYGVGKAAMDRMANDMAVELFTENVTMVSLWPGLVKTENVEDGALPLDKMKARRGLQPDMPKADFNAMMPSPLAETPLFSGRAVASLARDPKMMQYTGRILVPAIMAYGYDIVDERGVRSPPLTSLKSALAMLAQPWLESRGLWAMPGSLYTASAEPLSDAARYLWRTIPDFSIPGKLLKLAAGAPNL